MACRTKLAKIPHNVAIVLVFSFYLQFNIQTINTQHTNDTTISHTNGVSVENTPAIAATTTAIPTPTTNGTDNTGNTISTKSTAINIEVPETAPNISSDIVTQAAMSKLSRISSTSTTLSPSSTVMAVTEAAIRSTSDATTVVTETIGLRNISDVENINSISKIDDSLRTTVRTNIIDDNNTIEINQILTKPNHTLNVSTIEAPGPGSTGLFNEYEERAIGNCTGFPLLDEYLQPAYSAAARLRKCCPHGQNYDVSTSNGSFKCIPENIKFDAQIIDAVFYQHCIEDTEQPINLEYEYGIACDDDALLYNKNYGDLLYVLQNGSLLRVHDDFSSYEVSTDYCLDMHREDKILTALVCVKQSRVGVSKAEAYLYATCLLVSVPCLFVTTFFYIHIDELRNLHGKSLACHSLCLAFAFLLIGVAQIRGRVPQSIGYVIQYFMLACFCWVAVMCADICIHVWWHLPKYKNITPKVKTRRFILYSAVSFGVPFILVLLAYSAHEPGQPSYYLKGVKEDARTPLNYFIPPISSILFICFGLLVCSYFGFRNIVELEAKAYIMQKSYEDGTAFYNQAEHCFKIHIDDVERTARSTAYLYLIMTINWIFEIISFYTQTPSSSSLVLFDVLNALQGVVIFIIFLCLPRPKRIITRWWKSQGSLDCNTTEMEVLNNRNHIKN